MPTHRPRRLTPRLNPAARRAQDALERRFLAVIDWKNAVNAEAWRAVLADGGNHCDAAEFARAEAAVIASGHPRPPEPWPDSSQWPRHWYFEPLWPHEEAARNGNLTRRDLGTRPRRV
jgi:hypothetical protein